jgi:hypothetical protein
LFLQYELDSVVIEASDVFKLSLLAVTVHVAVAGSPSLLGDKKTLVLLLLVVSLKQRICELRLFMIRALSILLCRTIFGGSECELTIY